MTPVILLSEGYLAEAAEPWKLPDIDKLPKITVTHPKATKDQFLPYSRDPETLARPWAIPGSPGLEHRIGGLGKADLTGNVSYDPENNQKMMNLRREKIARIANYIPELEVRGPKSGKLLVVGWGGTYGAIYQAVSDLEAEGKKVSQIHLSYINPFQKNLGDILKKFETILIPELNAGQLMMLLRNQFPGIKAVGLNKMKGHPFHVAEIVEKIKEML